MFSKSRFCFQTLFNVHPYLKEKDAMMFDFKKTNIYCMGWQKSN